VKFVDRLLFKATGRKALVFLVASVFLACGLVSEGVWQWVAAVTIGGIAIEKGLAALGGKE